MKFLKDSDYVIEYQAGKANFAVDALSKKSSNNIAVTSST